MQMLAVPEDMADKLKEAKTLLATAVGKWKTLKEAGAKAVDDDLMKFGYAGFGDEKPIPPRLSCHSAPDSTRC
jgi:hypothetical protein